MKEVKTLVVRAQQGDLAAFESLVTIYQNRIYSLALGLSGNPTDAEDLAQEIFVRAYLALPGFRNEADFGTWLHRIGVNLWINEHNRRQRVTLVPLDPATGTEEGETAHQLAEAGGEPEEALEKKELHTAVWQTIGELAADYRVALVLRDIEGYTYKEIAAIIGCTEGTVKSRVSRAREALRQKLRAGGWQPGTRKVPRPRFGETGEDG